MSIPPLHKWFGLLCVLQLCFRCHIQLSRWGRWSIHFSNPPPPCFVLLFRRVTLQPFDCPLRKFDALDIAAVRNLLTTGVECDPFAEAYKRRVGGACRELCKDGGMPHGSKGMGGITERLSDRLSPPQWRVRGHPCAFCAHADSAHPRLNSDTQTEMLPAHRRMTPMWRTARYLIDS